MRVNYPATKRQRMFIIYKKKSMNYEPIKKPMNYEPP